MIERLKKLYEKPSVQYAVNAIVIGAAQHLANQLGYELVKQEHVEKSVEIKNDEVE